MLDSCVQTIVLCKFSLFAGCDRARKARAVLGLPSIRLFFVLFLNKIPQIVTNFLVSTAQDGKVSVNGYVA